MVEISLVLPAYNDAERIRDTVERVISTLCDITASFELIIAEDGSNKICDDLIKKYDFIVHLHSDERLGRGRAINHAFKISKGKKLYDHQCGFKAFKRESLFKM